MSSPKAAVTRSGSVLQVDFCEVSRDSRVVNTICHPSSVRADFTEQNWHDSERLFSQVFNNSPQPMSITTLAECRYLDVNASFLSLLGYTREQVIGRASLELGIWQDGVQRTELVKVLVNKGKIRDYETTLKGAEGQALVWLSSADLIELNGTRLMLITSNDITERRRTEERLKNVSARFIRAQEDERNRIARELHDGLNQKLAMLCVDLDELSQTHRDPNAGRKLTDLSLRLREASADVHGLSHELHPSELDHLGLLSALKSLCRDVSGRRGLNIEFASPNERIDFDDIDKELALCAYRVVQEALSNVIKHSGASVARVQLKRRPHFLQLQITDSGKGFDVSKAKLKGRLGLVSMEERLRLANGRLAVRSRPLRGTEIEATIPLP